MLEEIDFFHNMGPLNAPTHAYMLLHTVVGRGGRNLEPAAAQCSSPNTWPSSWKDLLLNLPFVFSGRGRRKEFKKKSPSVSLITNKNSSATTARRCAAPKHKQPENLMQPCALSQLLACKLKVSPRRCAGTPGNTNTARQDGLVSY